MRTVSYWTLFWMSFYDVFLNETNVLTKHPMVNRLKHLIEVCASVRQFIPFKKLLYICEHPVAIDRDEQGRLHHGQHAAIQWPDGWGVWAWHGVRVPWHIIENPQSLTIKEIDGEQNSEVRRVMIHRFGQERYLVKGNAKKIHEDRYGILYRKERSEDSPLCMVHVINSTPEPDGSLKPYFLRVPPEIETARAAVAWSFAMNEKEYEPTVES